MHTPPGLLDPELHGYPGRVAIDIVGGGYTDPGDTELDSAIEIIVGDYIPDSLLRAQLAQRIMAEVLRRTPITDPYARPTRRRPH